MADKNIKDLIAGYSFDEWEKVKKQFENDFKKSKKYNRSFGEIINEILDGENIQTFTYKTSLGENMLKRLRSHVDENNPPLMKTLMSVCVGYKLDLMMTQALLHSLGLDFNRLKKRDYAYTYLLTRCRGKSIDECNEILNELGVEKKDWLGIYAAKNKVK